MESSRIFVRGLPPTFKEDEFKKHFGQKYALTDVKLFPQRRIGYVGYKTPEDAVKAVKYFNKSFIRMSKIGVEIARPIQDAKPLGLASAPTAQRTYASTATLEDESNPLKRKRGSQGKEEEDPKLKEFLQAMKPASKTKSWQNDDGEAVVDATEASVKPVNEEAAAGSDDEYEDVPTKKKRTTKSEAAVEPQPTVNDKDHDAATVQVPLNDAPDEETHAAPADPSASDADWLRSRTSRLLGIQDDEEDLPTRQTANDEDSDAEPPRAAAIRAQTSQSSPPEELTVVKHPEPTAIKDDDHTPTETKDAATESVRTSMRLFLRNLSYSVQDEDITAAFSRFGGLLEVSTQSFYIHFFTRLKDDHPDRDNLCNADDVNREKILVDASH